MKKIQFFDTTLRDGEQTIGVNFSIEQKVTIAKQLEKWGVDVIEAGFPIASPEDFAACKAVSEAVTLTMITGLARCKKADIDACVQATKNARIKQIHVFIATSPIHREDKLHMTKEEVIASITEHVTYAKKFFDIVQFSPEDATRTELDFLAEAVQTAIDAGATVINIPDTVGYTNPAEFAHLFQYLRQHISNFDDITFSSHCHNDLGMATANTLAAIENGATRVEGTVNGIGEHAGNVALEQVAANFYVRHDYYQCEDNIKLEYTKETSEMVSRFSDMAVANNQPVTGVNCFAIESGIHQDGFLKNPQTYEILTPETVGMPATALPLGKLSGSHAVMDKLNHIGYNVDRGDMRILFPRFKAIADQTKLVSDAELHEMMQEYKKDVISA
ncbi:2-isopropylmalate synthase [Loigolactobacillus coryniformis]|uniref:2-isopropylmalate synthase n=1 Tax=Loigolactobacillus coryniformis subsp. torquens DSM 20004 = KCTC 3535 TaxID=1423822 RepID=A0A2D1KKF5_9LACO|nr:2-isopropylmalate synthase [Loigolactobacillus coryniformis]ATO42620.1 2-isopropylmalate synthase [Loigolactobacillus coryniformis subsp. torquens DSM 20004 = KCTC 3535]KRK85427.1 2-isopropylmalate synthase [Loigolactobacillus coryniformis subsp. torquens DSM 20004 = KCTC 3535]MCL5457099.1 2-isopropylmalate synthase [Loigolactobacillus coryniformis]